MSLADNKRNIFTTIGSYTSLIEETKNPLQTDIFPSINNKKDIVPFLLDVLKTVAGTEVLKELIGGLFTKLIDDVEPQLKTVLKKQFIRSNSNDPLPSSFINGITIPVGDLDISEKLKLDPDSAAGNLLYNLNSANFDKSAYQAILDSGSATPTSYSNLTIKHDNTSDTFQIKPAFASNTVSEFFTTYIDDAVLIDKKEITTKVMDAMYGTLGKEQGKTVSQNEKELKVSLLLEQVLNDDNSFMIPQEDLNNILEKAMELSAGELNYDMGCGLMATELQFDDFDDTLKSISGSTDPFYVGNQIENTITQSTSGSTTTETVTEDNQQTIKDGFFQRIINIFTIKLLEAVTITPQIRMLFAVQSSLENNGISSIGNPVDDMENFKTCIKCMAKEIMRLIGEYIFDLAVVYLLILLKPVIKKVLKEKINQYVGIIKSLTGVTKLLT